MKGKLEHELSKLKHGDHICSIYNNTAEQLTVALPFLIDGLARGERCIYIVDDRTIEEVVQALALAGVNVARESQRGALRLLTRQDTCLRAGEFAPQAMIDFIRQAEADALADGFSGLRQMGEMTWLLGPEPGCDRLIEFEALVNPLFENSKIVGLCQYNDTRFDAPYILDVVRTHPLAILGDQICTNPYYELPEMVLSKDQAGTTLELKAKRVDWWIAQLKRMQAAEQERERTIEKLKRSERRLAEAQRVAHIGSWERDLRTNEVNWSDELYRLFGQQPHEGTISYQQFLNLVLPEDANLIRTQVDEAIRERRRFNLDYRITLPDGSVRVLNDRGSIVLNEEGAPIRLVGTCQDVTERTQTERALQESHNLLRAVIEGIPDMVFVKDYQGRYLVVNSETARFVGKPAEDILGRDDAALFDPETARRFMDVDRRVIETGRAETYEKCTTALANNTYLTTKAPLWGPNGEVRGVLAISRNITKEKRAEEELKQQKAILQTIFDHIPVMINFIDAAGRVQMVNRHWERVLGWSLEEAQARDLLPECYPDPVYRARAIEYIQHPPPGWTDFKLRLRDGRTLDTSWAVIVLQDGTRIGFGQDITERRQAEQALQEYAARLQSLSRRQLEVQEEERRHLARELHDEVGQLLTALGLILKPDADLTTDVARAGFEKARTLVDELLDMVRQLSFDLRPAALDQLGLLPGLLALFDRYTKQTGVLVNFKHQGLNGRFAPEVETTAYRIVQEALTNVARHAAVTSVSVRVWTTVDMLSGQIEDRGRGFDAEDTLARLRSSGLPGMQERVTLLGGRLTIESRPGAGTQITAELPMS